MQATYRTSHRYSQAENVPDVESINILEIAEEVRDVSPPDQVDDFWSRLPETGSKRRAVRAIADEWLTGCYNADDAVGWLRILKLHSCPHSADPFDTMATIARREFGPVALPERPEGHVQPPPPDLVRVTAMARQRRNGRDAA